MAVQDRCSKCGSAKIIPHVKVVDQGEYSDGSLKAFLGNANPQAIFFKKGVFASLNATICGECGYTELAVENPAELYEKYQNLPHQE